MYQWIQGKKTTWKLLVNYATDGDIDKMNRLLKKGVDPNSMKDRVTALQAAILISRVELRVWLWKGRKNI